MKLVDFFSGAGGLTCGLNMAGPNLPSGEILDKKIRTILSCT